MVSATIPVHMQGRIIGYCRIVATVEVRDHSVVPTSTHHQYSYSIIKQLAPDMHYKHL